MVEHNVLVQKLVCRMGLFPCYVRFFWWVHRRDLMLLEAVVVEAACWCALQGLRFVPIAR